MDFATLPYFFFDDFPDFPFFFFKSRERGRINEDARSAAIRPSTKKSPTRDTDFKKILGREEKTIVKNNGVSVVGKSWMEYLRRSLPIRLS